MMPCLGGVSIAARQSITACTWLRATAPLHGPATSPTSRSSTPTTNSPSTGPTSSTKRAFTTSTAAGSVSTTGGQPISALPSSRIHGPSLLPSPNAKSSQYRHYLGKRLHMDGLQTTGSPPTKRRSNSQTQKRVKSSSSSALAARTTEITVWLSLNSSGKTL